MKLVPLQGVDEVRFGDDVSKVISMLGIPVEKRSHPDVRQRTSLTYPGLTLGFAADDRLSFIAVHECAVELWGERPFEIAYRSSDAYVDLKHWLRSSGRSVHPDQDCFGATLSVSEEGVTFCFVPPDSKRLEGIQLYPR
jgi:hypothetical protein